MRARSWILQERQGRETEAELKLRAFDLRALDDSSGPTAASKTHTFVYTGMICKAVGM